MDEYVVVRSGIEQLLAQFGGAEIVCRAGDVSGLDTGPQYDVLLLGVHGGGGVQKLLAVARSSSPGAVVAVCGSTKLASILVLLDAGVEGYLTLQADDKEFCEAVTTVAGGGFYVCPKIRTALEGEEQHVEGRPGPKLAPREQEALWYIARGYTHAQVARRMGVSVCTVETYLLRLRRKFNVKSTAALIRLSRQVPATGKSPQVRRGLDQEG